MSLKYSLIYTGYIGTLVIGNPTTHLARQLVNSTLDPTPNFRNGTLHMLNETVNGTPYMLNETVASLDVAGIDDIHIQCDGASYGFDLDIVDCEKAKAYIPASSKQVQWAERHTGWQKEIFLLPYRAMGNKALCYVQPILIDRATSARANTNQVRNAAAAIRDECYSNGKLQGGIATNIGGDNNLAVTMGGYRSTSDIQCRGRFSPITSCEDVLEDMPVTSEVEVFGPPTDPSAQVWVPQVVQSDDTKCLLTIYATSATSDKISWYEVWEATTAIWSVCVRHGLGGGLRGVGEFSSSGVVKLMANAFGYTGDNGNLLLTMSAPSADAPNEDSYLEMLGDLQGVTSLKAPMALHVSKYYGKQVHVIGNL